jgi:hypothetical protein
MSAEGIWSYVDACGGTLLEGQQRNALRIELTSN